MEAISLFLEGISAEFGALGGIVTVLLFLGGGVTWLFRRNNPPKVEVTNLPPPAPAIPENTIQMDVAAFTALQTKLREDARKDLSQAHGAERTRLENKIEELNRRLAQPEEALSQQQAIISRLEDELTRRANTLGGDRVADAKAALKAGDTGKAKALFEEVKARTALDVTAHTEAEFALGEIAETEVRWHDAYTHYKRAAALDDDLDHINALARMAWRLGKSAEGIALYERLRHAAKARHGADSPQYATQLNNLASLVLAQGRFAEAETLYGEALAIGRKTLGDAHPTTKALAENYLITLTSINAPAAVTFAVSVTSALASMPASLVSSAVV